MNASELKAFTERCLLLLTSPDRRSAKEIRVIIESMAKAHGIAR